MTSPTVDWRWWLVKTSDLTPIAELERAHNRRLQVVLNQPGVATCNLNLLDADTENVVEHQTSLLLYRNNRPVWSGPIFKCVEDSTATVNTLSITAMGWFELLNHRIIHTGKEWTEMLTAYEAAGSKYGPYVQVGVESSLQLYYAAEKGNTITTIMKDHLARANVDVPTGITIGLEPKTEPINYTAPQFHPVGESIFQLSAIEHGPDYEVDPVTRKFNIYWNVIRGGIIGKGIDRGPGIRFTYPGNCTGANRSADGTKTRNRVEAMGTYGVAVSNRVASIDENGLFETMENLADVTHIEILEAYANIQVATLEKPFTIITFTPRAVSPNDSSISGVPRPYDDYELGDIVYATIERGPRFRVGTKNPQPVRVYGYTIDIDDTGVEKVSGLQTTYTS